MKECKSSSGYSSHDETPSEQAIKGAFFLDVTVRGQARKMCGCICSEELVPNPAVGCPIAELW
jgi:hypothetical protein